VITFIATRSVVPALRALALGSSTADPEGLVTLDALPFRLALLDLIGAGVVSILTFFPPFRPSTNDLTTQGAIVVLAMTIACAAALPHYVMMRSAVGKVLELTPPEPAREAVMLLDAGRVTKKRLGNRILAATVAPVAFV